MQTGYIITEKESEMLIFVVFFSGAWHDYLYICHSDDPAYAGEEESRKGYRGDLQQQFAL